MVIMAMHLAESYYTVELGAQRLALSASANYNNMIMYIIDVE